MSDKFNFLKKAESANARAEVMGRRFINFLFRWKTYYVSVPLKCLWLFFPGILSIFIGYAAFVILSQGFDLIVDSTEVLEDGITWKLFFVFLACNFWAVVNWFSARLVSYRKKEMLETYDDKNPWKKFYVYLLRHIPRFIGISTFAVLQIAYLNNPIVKVPWSSGITFLLVVVLNIALYILIKKIRTPRGRHVATYYLALLICGGVAVLIVPQAHAANFNSWFMALLFLYCSGIFSYMVVVRRKMIEENAGSHLRSLKEGNSQMTVVFNMMSFAALLLYAVMIISIPFARAAGSLTFAMLGLAILIGFANLLTSFSVKFYVNLHFVFVGIAVVFGMFCDPYEVHFAEHEGAATRYEARPSLETYFDKWYELHESQIAAADEYPAYFVMSNGGASRSGYWVASVLGCLTDSCGSDFTDHLVCLSGASGGSVGNAAYYSLLYHERQSVDSAAYSFHGACENYLSQDFLSPTLGRMLGPDYFRHVFPYIPIDTRVRKLEESLEETNSGNFDQFMTKGFSDYIPDINAPNLPPILHITTTRSRDGFPGLISTVRLDDHFNGRIDLVEDLITSREEVNEDLNLSTASILSARFPYVSPAGGINDNYFVDGGYFDNSGAGPVFETIDFFMSFLESKPDSIAGKVKPVVIHLSNSEPSTPPSTTFHPLVNDLFAPIITLAGSYSKQTVVNDARLESYLKKMHGDSSGFYKINLFIDREEVEESMQIPASVALGERESRVNARFTQVHEAEYPYSMSWYMSDTCRRAIQHRLNTIAELQELIEQIRQ